MAAISTLQHPFASALMLSRSRAFRYPVLSVGSWLALGLSVLLYVGLGGLLSTLSN